MNETNKPENETVDSAASAADPAAAGLDPAASAADPAAIMEEVRERVRMESLAEGDAGGEGVGVGELRELARDIRELRQRLASDLKERPELLRMVATLDHSAFEDLEEARETRELPPARRVAKIAPLHLLFKVYRKGVLKSQRLFNKATYALFRRMFRNFLLLEKQQLSVLDELRRLDEFEERLTRLESQIDRLAEKD